MNDRQSIFSTHISFVAAIFVIVAIFTAVSVQSAISNYRASVKATAINKITDHLFEAVRHFGYERGRINVVLNREPGLPSTASDTEFFLKQRSLGEEHVMNGITFAERHGIFTDPEDTNGIYAARNRIVELRKIAERELSLPVAERDPELPQQWFDAMSAYIRQIEIAARYAYTRLPGMDGKIMNLFRIKASAIQMRDNAGPVASYLAAGLLSPASFTEQRYHEIIARQESAARNLDTIIIASRELEQPELARMIDELESSFTDGFARHIAPIIDAVTTGSEPHISQPEFTRIAVDYLERIAAVTEAANAITAQRVTMAKNTALSTLVLTIFMMIFMVVYLLFSLRVVNNMVYRPVVGLTRLMRRLAGGDSDFDIPHTDSNDEIGDMARTLGVFRENQLALHDLTRTLEARVESETDRRIHSESMLLQQSRMAAVGEMIDVIGHQWKQPLNAISLTIQLLEMNSEGDEDIAKASGIIREQVVFMSDTIDTFRRFFHTNTAPEPFDVARATRNVSNLLSPQFSKHRLAINLSIPDTPIMASGIRSEYKQAVLSIMVNSRDAIIDAGMEQGTITVAVTVENDHALVRISDNGPGIPEHVRTRIFDREFSTKGDVGSGLGLYMTRIIIEERMNGTVSAPPSDSGAVFEIRLPLAD